MTDNQINDVDQSRGHRAEEVAEWYFRLNGFFLIPGFVVHPDTRQQYVRTEADLLGVRLRYSVEGFRASLHRGGRSNIETFSPMKDHEPLVQAGMHGAEQRHQIAMVEVKAGRAQINGPWTNRGAANMSRALGRVGFGNKDEVKRAAEAMYDKLRYVGPSFIVQYYSVCGSKNSDLGQQYPSLIQITFDEIANFLCGRFQKFPQKIPENTSWVMWDGIPTAERPKVNAEPPLGNTLNAENVISNNRKLQW